MFLLLHLKCNFIILSYMVVWLGEYNITTCQVIKSSLPNLLFHENSTVYKCKLVLNWLKTEKMLLHHVIKYVGTNIKMTKNCNKTKDAVVKQAETV